VKGEEICINGLGEAVKPTTLRIKAIRWKEKTLNREESRGKGEEETGFVIGEEPRKGYEPRVPNTEL